MRVRLVLIATLFFVIASMSQGGPPAPLDLGNLRLADRPSKSAVGGGSTIETFVAPFGTFTLGDEEFKGIAIYSGTPAYARKFKLYYLGEFRDAGTGTVGSLYWASGAPHQGRFVLFGKDRIACADATVEQRMVITWDAKGNVIHGTQASYARLIADKKKERD